MFCLAFTCLWQVTNCDGGQDITHYIQILRFMLKFIAMTDSYQEYLVTITVANYKSSSLGTNPVLIQRMDI
jgi:hypothetical protein